MISISKPIFATITGTPYEYKNYTLSINQHWSKSSGSISLSPQDVVSDMFIGYQGSAFIGASGKSDIYLNDIIKDVVLYNEQTPFVGMYHYGMFDVMINGVLLDTVCMFDTDAYYNGFKNHYTSLVRNAITLNGNELHLKIGTESWVSTDTSIVSMSIVPTGNLSVTSDVVNVSYVEDKDCSIKDFYLQFETQFGFVYSNGFDSVSIATESIKDTIVDFKGCDYITDIDTKERYIINTGVLSKVEYDLLTKSLPHANYIRIVDLSGLKRGGDIKSKLCILENNSFESENNLNMNASNRQLTITLNVIGECDISGAIEPTLPKFRGIVVGVDTDAEIGMPDETGNFTLASKDGRTYYYNMIDGATSTGDELLCKDYGGGYYWEHIKSVSFVDCDSITTIDDYFLNEVQFMESLDLSGLKNAAKIESDFLQGCLRLKAVDLSQFKSLVSVGDAFLSKCLTITDVDLSNSEKLASIGSWFLGGGVGKVKSIKIGSMVVPNTNSEYFLESVPSDCEITVRCELVDKFKSTSPWKERADHIIGDC